MNIKKIEDVDFLEVTKVKDTEEGVIVSDKSGSFLVEGAIVEVLNYQREAIEHWEVSNLLDT